MWVGLKQARHSVTQGHKVGAPFPLWMGMKTKAKDALTKKELAICHEVERQVTEENEGWVARHCWLNGQRATMCDERLLYHEGYIVGIPMEDADRDGRFRHAWNTLNGKLVDFSSPLKFEDQHSVAEYYKADHTSTKREVLAASLARSLRWSWIKEAA
jgi:hypothetical protein